jgi:glycerate 2-kinase
MLGVPRAGPTHQPTRAVRCGSKRRLRVGALLGDGPQRCFNCFAPFLVTRSLPRMPQRVLVACDKLKDALTAERACAIVAREIRRAHPDWKIELAPITDGGEGFARILTNAVGGEWTPVPASGPRLERIQVSVGFVDGARIPAAARALLPPVADRRVAIIEMAAVSGLALVPPDERDPWRTTSYGTGQLIRAAAELGAGAILLGVGGSATSDLGLGALAALGFEFRDTNGAKVRPPFPAAWERITHIEGEAFASIPPIAIACDVTNPLLGPNGAAAIFGPQKGLRAADLPRHEMLAARMANLLAQHCARDPAAMSNQPGAGAAGGIAFGLMTAARGQLVPGFSLVSAWLDLDAKVAAADLVITGEGRFDASSLAGKGPGAVVQRARAAGKRAIVFAGSVDGAATSDDVHAITPSGTPLPEALAQTESNLVNVIARVLS